MRRTALPLLLLLSGCSAGFSFEFTGEFTGDGGAADGRGSDGAAGPADAGPPSDLSGVVEQLVASGSFVGRAGHLGQGGTSLWRLPAGGLELRMDAGFSVSGVPGPYVFLTSRADMGVDINPNTDIEIGRLISTSGVQTYALPAGDYTARPHVFVFCKPFRVEVAKATLRFQ